MRQRGIAAGVRELTDAEQATPEFRHLLWLACEHPDAELDRLLTDELPRLTVVGIVDAGEPVAFAAFHEAADETVVEYIATVESSQGRGLGRRLVAAVAVRRPVPVVAQTDDDAVDFYRRLGFEVADAPQDARWPERRRYDCRLRPR